MVLRRLLVSLLFGMVFMLFVGCNSSDVNDAIDDGKDLVNGPERREIDTSRLGLNAFANDSRFGSASAQFLEVRDGLGLSFVRILFNWDDGVQPAPSSALNLSFYDSLVSALPAGVDALVVLTGAPEWMNNSANWLDGNPRHTFVEKFVRPVARRYGGNGRIIGWQIWNEPNMLSNPDNHLMDVAESPENYVELLAKAHAACKSVASGKMVVNAATTAINQNFPESLDYNKRMVTAGIEGFLDRYAIHYYGKQFENVVRPDGVKEFLDGRDEPIWITESGAQGVSSQLAYGEQTWPYLFEKISGLERIYVYQFTENTPSGTTYGLKNLSDDFPVSDLYVSLRDRAQD